MILRWTGRIAVGLVVLVAVIALSLAFWLRLSVPDYSGTAQIAGLRAPVQVWRDQHAVPHIFAANDLDAYRALGYVHAQDRFWQMDMNRRIGAGRLSEVLGTVTLDFDKFMRTLGIYRQAQASYEVLAPEVQQALDAYAQGVNAWREQAGRPIGPEFLILRYTPDPWTPADSIVWGKLLSLQLSSNFSEELLRGRLATRLTGSQMEDLFPPGLGGPPVTLAGLFDLPMDLGMPLGPNRASNVWVVSGSRTESGAPILTNDPHLGLDAPILWYLARIETPSLQIAGATVPGVPFHLLGHNEQIAWGFTTTGGDVQDLFVERLVPDQPDGYETPSGPATFRTRDEVIQVRGSDPVTLTVRHSRHGPVISDVSEDARTYLESVWGEGYALSLAFTLLSDRDTSAEAIYRLNRATDWQGFVDSLSHWRSALQNIAYADVDGTIGLFTPGRVPIRERGDGLTPRPGWEAGWSWTGRVAHEALPQSRDPEQGYLVNANNAIVGPGYPYFIADAYEEAYRARRIVDRIEADDGATPLGHVDMLADSVSLAAREVLPLLLDRVDASGPVAREAVMLLRRWDHEMDRDRPEPLIFTAWLRALNRQLFADELGDLFQDYWGLEPVTVQRVLTDRTAWCDDVTTEEETETCALAVATALQTTLDSLTDQYGTDPTTWRWGDAHRAPLAHRIYGRVPVIRDWFDIGVETDGGVFTVNRGAHSVRSAEAPFAHTHGAGYRAVYDLADLSASRFHITTGQAGHPFSPHYGDFVPLWADNRYITLTGAPQDLEATHRYSLTLRPAPP